MSVLGKEQILERLRETDDDKRLYITPLLNRDDQVDQCSVDLRLSNEFIITQQTNIVKIDIGDKGDFAKSLGRHQDLVRVNFGEQFVLHPNHLVLASTLEYIRLPNDVCAQIEGRSSWGRVGLVIATATSVAPRFTGVVTLELINLGLVPLTLYPGVKIAQMALSSVSSETDYHGRYRYPTGPQFSKIFDDKDSKFWTQLGNFSRIQI